ncbi:putative portal protein [Klebsiella phage P528]|uniref:Putative portal protein n=1 Tax=Klebsiella phage P528 TaxID=2777348 RepID=A0A7T3NA46_9CAUD|nr:putative portal protein [Klebsiella phage P528]
MKAIKMDDYNQIFNGGAGYASTTAMIASTFGDMSQVEEFYHSNGLAKKIVDVIPEEMVSPGFQLNGVSDNTKFQSEWDGLKLEPQITDALCWARLYGGSYVLAMVNDGRMLTSAAKRGKPLESIVVYDYDSVSVAEEEKNPRSPRFGKPKMYTVKPLNGGSDFNVHYTRMHYIDGERVTNKVRKLNKGAGGTVLNKSMIEAILDYDYSEYLATQLLKRKQQGVWKARGLALICDDREGEYAARLRMAQVDANSGVGNTIGIDADDEEYTVINSDISGIPEFLSAKMDRIVALSGIHEIVLKNKNTGGVSASQNTALQTFYKLVERKRNDDYKPLLEFLLQFIVTEEDFSVEFEPLSLPTDSEKADIFKKNAEAVQGLVTDQVIDANEARDTLSAMVPELKLKGNAPEQKQLPDRTSGSGKTKTQSTQILNNTEEGGDES